MLLDLNAEQSTPLALDSDFHWNVEYGFRPSSQITKEALWYDTLESGSGMATLLFSETSIPDAESEPLGVHDAQEHYRGGDLDLGQDADQGEVETPARVTKAENGGRSIRRFFKRRR